MGSLRDGVGGDRVESDGRQQHRDGRKRRERHPEHPKGPAPVREEIVHRPDTEHRQVGVEQPDLFSNERGDFGWIALRPDEEPRRALGSGIGADWQVDHGVWQPILRLAVTPLESLAHVGQDGSNRRPTRRRVRRR